MQKKLKSDIKGVTFFEKRIVGSIIKNSVKEVSGVKFLGDNSFEKLIIFNKSNNISNIEFKKAFSNIELDVYIDVTISNNVTEAAYMVQDNIKNALYTMLDIVPKKININVNGISVNR